MLAVLFLSQLVVGGVARTLLRASGAGELELLAFSALYVVLAILQLYRARRALNLSFGRAPP